MVFILTTISLPGFWTNTVRRSTDLCRYFRHSPASLPILQLPINAIPLGTWVPKIGEPNRRPLAMLRPTASLSAALNLLIQGLLAFLNRNNI